MVRTYYDSLGLSADCSPAEVKKAYKKLAVKFHPDKAGEASTQRFQEISTAYEVLSDPHRRQEYDDGLRFGGARGETTAGFGGFGGFGAFGRGAGPFDFDEFHRKAHEGSRDPFDMFNEIFGEGLFGSRRGSGRMAGGGWQQHSSGQQQHQQYQQGGSAGGRTGRMMGDPFDDPFFSSMGGGFGGGGFGGGFGGFGGGMQSMMQQMQQQMQGGGIDMGMGGNSSGSTFTSYSSTSTGGAGGYSFSSSTTTRMAGGRTVTESHVNDNGRTMARRSVSGTDGQTITEDINYNNRLGFDGGENSGRHGSCSSRRRRLLDGDPSKL